VGRVWQSPGRHNAKFRPPVDLVAALFPPDSGRRQGPIQGFLADCLVSLSTALAWRLALPSQAALGRSFISWEEVKARLAEVDDEDNADLPTAA
jgi:hypothetical protein